MRQPPEAVVFEFKEEVVMVEWLSNEAKLGRIDSRRAHINMMHANDWVGSEEKTKTA